MAAPLIFALCADDYAMAPGVSRGILEALDAGRLTATSALTTMEAWPRAAAALLPFADRADLGLHLNLTLGRPLGPMPKLARAGELPRVAVLIAAARRDMLPLDEISAEIERQLDAFYAAAGRPPDHVDGHQHIQVLAPVRRLLIDALRRRGWSPWLRDSSDRPLRILRRRSTFVKAAGVAVLARGFAAEAHGAALATNEGFAGFSAFDAATHYDTRFERYLVAPGSSHLVMCHPGHVDATLRTLDHVVESRERELDFMISPRFQEVLDTRGTTLARLAPAPSTPGAFKNA